MKIITRHLAQATMFDSDVIYFWWVAICNIFRAYEVHSFWHCTRLVEKMLIHTVGIS